MNKLPTKQIYLLTIIIVGIIALSVYSTYALFTFESETSDIVSIHIPKSLQISENIYEYQQLVLEPNSIITTDVDIYNSYKHDVCYSIWYKVVGDNSDESKVQVFEYNSEVLTTSGVLTHDSHLRVPIAIINDNNTQIKLNIGIIGAEKESDSCSLNLSSDKKVISSTYGALKKVTTELLNDKEKVQEVESNYLVYNDIIEIISLEATEKMYISDKFSYSDEVFTLDNYDELTPQELMDAKYLETKDIYYCESGNTCSILYKIKQLEKSPNDEIISYTITKYDKMIGYTKGANGLRKINETDYVFYGDNPNNFIYYNCQNNDDINTCELWRIIGLFYNEEKDEYVTKIIRNNSIGKYQFDYKIENDENKTTDIWNESSLNKYLNKEYQFINNSDIYIEEIKQKREIISSLETEIANMKTNEYINSKVNIVTLSDYLNASSCQKTKINDYTTECLKNNWLNNIEIEREWTLTSKKLIEVAEDETENIEGVETTDSETITENNNGINYVYSIGNDITENNANDELEIRPVVFLKSRMLLSGGNGTLENPYIVK